jgi:hypothetical protein
MKKIILSTFVLLTWGTSLFAQITREQADTIVIKHIHKKVSPPSILYVYNYAPSANEIVIATYNEEVIKIKHACWAYYLNENPENSTPCQHRYLFVKENNGNLLEIITSNDLIPNDLTVQWTFMDSIMVSVNNIEKKPNIVLYPNPTTGELRVTSYELQVAGIEVFDVYGRKVLSNHHITSSTHPLTNISHLSSGIYFVRIKTENGEVTQKVIKN